MQKQRKRQWLKALANEQSTVVKSNIKNIVAIDSIDPNNPITVILEHTTYGFENGYGASIIKLKNLFSPNEDSYTLELAVMVKHEGTYIITYNTKITNDVVRIHSKNEISKLLKEIKNLKAYNDVKE